MDKPAAEPKAEAPDRCRWQHNILFAAVQRGDRLAIVAEADKLAEEYRQLRAQEPVSADLRACRRLVEPILRDIANVWYLEGRPGHPNTYSTTGAVLATLLDVFPDTDEAPVLMYRLAEVTAVIASDKQDANLWRKAANLYASAAAADWGGVFTIHRGRATRSLREAAVQAKEVCLKNASDPIGVRERPWW